MIALRISTGDTRMNLQRDRWITNTRPATLLALIMMMLVGGCKWTDNNITSLRDEGQWAYKKVEYEQSADYYRAALELKPEDPRANLGLGRALLAMGEFQFARTPLEIAYNDAWADADKSYKIAQDLAKAMAGAEQYEDLFTFLSHRADTTGHVRDYLLWADFAQQTGDPDTATQACLIAARIDETGSPEPYYQLGLLYEQLGDSEAALKRFRQAFGLAPNDQRIISKLEQYVTIIGPTLALPPDR